MYGGAPAKLRPGCSRARASRNDVSAESGQGERSHHATHNSIPDTVSMRRAASAEPARVGSSNSASICTLGIEMPVGVEARYAAA